MYGQDEIEIHPDGRGVIPQVEADQIRKLRAEEQWERFDSVVIGQTAAEQSRGWFNTWNQFSSAQQLRWFSGRDPGVGSAFTNQFSERSDWAQDFHQVTCEFIAPPGFSDIENDQNDALITPMMFAQMLPQYLNLQVVLSDSDSIAQAPASHFPAGFGTSYPLVSGASAPTVFAGNNGEPVVSNSWKFPSPVMLAAKSSIRIEGEISQPLRAALQAMAGPGSKNIPTANPQEPFQLANFYIIRITLRGPRYLQLRGARSSA